MDEKSVEFLLRSIDYGLKNRLKFCFVVKKIFGEFGQNALILYHSGLWVKLKGKFFELVKKVSGVEIEKCLDIVINSFLDLDFGSFLDLISVLVEKISLDKLHKQINSLISNGLINVNKLLDLFDNVKEENVVFLAKIFIVFSPFFSGSVREKILKNLLKFSSNAEVLYWLKFVDLGVLDRKKFLSDIDKIFHYIKSYFLDGVESKSFLETINVAYFLYEKGGSDIREIIDRRFEEVGNFFRLNALRRLLKSIPYFSTGDVNAILWFLDKISHLIDYRFLLKFFLEIIKENIEIKMGYLASILAKSKISDFDNFYFDVKTLSKKKFWPYRLFSAFICGEMVKRGEKRFIDILESLCSDKRSIVRSNAAMLILESIEDLGDIELDRILLNVLKSKKYNVYKKVLDFIVVKKPKLRKRTIENMLKFLLKDPRTISIKLVLSMVTIYQNFLDPKNALRILVQILKYSKNRKNLFDEILDAIKDFLKLINSDERKNILDDLKNFGVSIDLD